MKKRTLIERFPLLLEPTFVAGVACMVLVWFPILIGRLFVTPEMAEVFADLPNQSISWSHWLGTQSEGRDVATIIIYGAPATLGIGLVGGGLALIIGATLGFLAGYVGGKIDTVIRTLVDVGLTIPSLAILIMIAASFPVLSIWTMGIIVASTAWMPITRIIRAQVLSYRQADFIKLARLSGAGNVSIIVYEIAPNLIPFLAATFVSSVTSATLASIGLEAFGLGTPGAFTLGRTIYDALYYSAMWRGMWWWWMPPIMILVVLFSGLFLLSIALDRIGNPKMGR
jgi:peptide/nickel transport system permease protein